MAIQQQGAQQYAAMGKQSSAAYADPHQLIVMLFDGVLERIASAKGAMQRNAVAEKGVLISKAITIVDGLRAHLNPEKGGEVAANLKDMYDYIERILFAANAENDESKLDEAAVLVGEIRAGWVGIADEAKEIGFDHLNEADAAQ